jgi:LysM repeat protein
LVYGALLVLFTAGCQRTLIEVGTPGDASAAPAPTAANSDERRAVIQVVSGVADLRRSTDSPWAPAAPGQILLEDTQLRTGPGSRTLVLITEGSKIWLGPDTTFTVNILNPFLDSLLTSLALERGQVWVLLNGGALDIETPLGIVSARSAYLSAAFDPETGALDITCLQGTCSFGNIFIPAGFKLSGAQTASVPVAMTLADFGAWGINVPEATQLAALATEAVVQGNATLPVMPTETSATQLPAGTATAGPPTPASPLPNPPTVTSPPTSAATPVPAVPIIGTHIVRGGETLFCIARVYGVLPAAMAQANALPAPFIVVPGQKLDIPAVQWTDILPGPVCAPQFTSPYPGLPFSPATSTARPATGVPTTGVPTTVPPATSAPTATSVPAPAATLPPLTLAIHFQCLSSCDSGDTYLMRVTADASGGQAPYAFNPAQVQDLTLPHCADQSGTVMVTSADGQTLTSPWVLHDASCPAP